MRTIWVALFLGCVGVLDAAPRAPNIVFFLADDLGVMDLGVYGSSFYDTPHLDRMAGEGARFNHAYAACPVCSPTRASVMTGKYPQRTGITDYIGAPKEPSQWKRNTRLLPAPYHDRLDLDETTIAEALKSRGYATFFAGKWHLGPESHWPEHQGFDVNKGGHSAGGPYGGNKYFSPYGNPRLDDGPPGEHLPDRLAQETIQFMKAQRDRPFFAFLSFYSVHTPLMSPVDLEKKYAARRTERGLVTQWKQDGPREVRLTQDHAVYAGMVEAMDQAVGRVLGAIDDLGIRENTIVIFTSDNGGLSTSEGWPTSNQPFRAGKGWMYEGGIREPLLIRWPGVAAPGVVIETPVSSPDFFPTLIQAAGGNPVDYQDIDGVDIRSVLEGPRDLDRALYWHYPHYGNQGGAPSAAIRKGKWKLIRWFEGPTMELFDLEKDPGETHDVSLLEPALLAEMDADLRAWQDRVGAKFPSKNPAYDPSKPDGRISRRGGK